VITTRLRAPGQVAALALAALVLAAILAPVIAPRAMDAVDLSARRLPPSLAYLFGTDELGRDVLSRVLHGARVSLAVGLISAIVSVAIGALVGMVAALRRGVVDAMLMRFTDAMLIVPRLPLLLVLGAILRPSVPLLVVIVGAVGWMETARVVRARVLALVGEDYVAAATAAGAQLPRIVRRHLLPGVVPLLATATTLAVGRGILLESALSFLGVGVQPPTPSWGNMLYQAQAAASSAPWLAVFPGAMILLTVWLVNAIAERDRPGAERLSVR
jgi:peptide/nickel transport system permease protein